MIKSAWNKTVSFVKSAGIKIAGVLGFAAAGAVATSQPAHAVPTTMTDIFTAADVSGLQSNVGTLLLAFVAISLLFVAVRYLRKAGVR